jgi:DNA-binding transcriptional MerR regulator
MPQVEPVVIPNRALFRQPEVCEIAKVQPYVLRSWEAEFPDLGVAKTEGGPRVYRRADVERVLRLKHLLYVEGLTLAGARRRLTEEQPDTAAALAEVAELLGADARERILQVKKGLRELSAMLSRTPASGVGGVGGDEFELQQPAAPVKAAKPKRKAGAPELAKKRTRA